MNAADHASSSRRRALKLAAAGTLLALGGAGGATARDAAFSVVTFGDSILDCARYNDRGVHPGQLLVRNHDGLFPAFRGRDLASRGPANLDHRAQDGARVDHLAAQLRGFVVPAKGVALVTIGGNDLLGGLATDTGSGIARFERTLEAFLRQLPLRPVLLGTVYDPTFGDDARNFLAVDARVARPNFRRVNEVIAGLAEGHGRLVDLHAHFLRGDPSWFTRIIEPSLVGASEVRAAFLPAVEAARTG